MSRYRVFGHVIEYSGSFQWPVLPTDLAADLVLRLNPVYPCPLEINDTWFSKSRNGQNHTTLGQTKEGVLLRLPRLGDFHIGASEIVFHELNQECRKKMEPVFFQMVLPLWLELRGLLVLHASCVSEDDEALGFLANSRSGKSTLAGAFTQAGFDFLSDDILTLRKVGSEFLAYPSYPWLRLLPDSAQFLGYANPYKHEQAWRKNVIRLESNFGQYQATPSHLAALYLPIRVSRHQPVNIQTLKPTEAFVRVMQLSLTRRWTRNSPLEKARMSQLAELVRKVQVCQLEIPDTFDDLPSVIETVRTALNKVSGS